MSTVSSVGRITADELLRMPNGEHFELIDGELVEKPMALASALVVTEVSGLLREFNRQAKLGIVPAAEQGYRCFPDDPGRVRRPDASFIHRDRVRRDELEEGFVTIAPDLAVEVISPNELAYDVMAKARAYLDAGVKQVWVVYPNERTVFVHEADGRVAGLRGNDVLDGGDVLPGFRCPVSSFFQPLDDFREARPQDPSAALKPE